MGSNLPRVQLLVFERMAHSMQRHIERLLVELGQMLADLRLVQKEFDDLSKYDMQGELDPSSTSESQDSSS